jgi:NADH dehydrogenase/NADH:ubiquinone oxidoreductase subunit G
MKSVVSINVDGKNLEVERSKSLFQILLDAGVELHGKTTFIRR